MTVLDDRCPTRPLPGQAPLPRIVAGLMVLRLVVLRLMVSRLVVSRLVVMGLVVVGLAVVMVVPATPVGAQDPLDCDRPVIDTSGLVDVAAVEAAIATVDPEAVVVVRSFDQVPREDLVAAVDEVVVACFGDPDLAVRREVIVLGLSIGDRLSDVLIGSRWREAVPDPDRIRSEVMAPRFAEEDHTGGLVAAVEEIGRGIDRQLATADTSPEAGGRDETGSGADGESRSGRSGSGEEAATSDSQAGDDDGTPVDGGPIDGGGMAGGGVGGGGPAPSPLAVGLGALGIGACGGVIALTQRRRRLTAAREVARRSAIPARIRLGVQRERHARLLAQAELWHRASAGRTRSALEAVVGQAEEGRAATDLAAQAMAQVIPGDVDHAGQDQLERGREQVTDLVGALDHHDRTLDRLAALGAHLDHLLVALPTRARVLHQEVDENRELAELRASEGWKVNESLADLDDVASAADGIELTAPELDLLALAEAVEEAEGRLLATGHRLQSLAAPDEWLARWTAQLEEAAHVERRRIGELRRRLAAAGAIHATEAWHWAADHPELAAEALERAVEIQDDTAGRELLGADRLLDQVDDLLVDLERARVESAGIVEQSRQVLGSLTEYVERHVDDLEPELLDRPAELALAVDGLERELRRPRPNHLGVVETGERLNRRIDELLAQAQEQQIAAPARRRELERELARAWRALARARQALACDPSPSPAPSVSPGAEAVDRLEAVLGAVPSDIVEAIELAAGVAADALRTQELIIARRRRQVLWSTAGPHREGADRSLASHGAGGAGGAGALRVGSRLGVGRSFASGRAGGRW